MEKQKIDEWYDAAMRGLAAGYASIGAIKDVAPYARRLMAAHDHSQADRVERESPAVYRDLMRGEVEIPFLNAACELGRARNVLYVALGLEPVPTESSPAELRRYMAG